MFAPILTRRVTRRSLLATLGNLFLLGACGGGEIDKRIPLKSHFVPFGLCMSWDGRDGRSTWATTPLEQIALSQQAGYSGLGIEQTSPEGLKAFADHADVASGAFRIYSMLWWATAGQTLNETWLDGVLTQAARMNMALWVVVGGEKNATQIDAAVTLLEAVASRCRTYAVQLVLYPHSGTTFVCAEEALVIRDRLSDLGYPEVKLSVHLCHEQLAGNRNRLPEVVAKVAPWLALATVNGSNGGGDFYPLGQGSFDPSGYLQALADHDYRGPMELHTWSLPDPRLDDHLARSLAYWNTFMHRPATA